MNQLPPDSGPTPPLTRKTSPHEAAAAVQALLRSMGAFDQLNQNGSEREQAKKELGETMAAALTDINRTVVRPAVQPHVQAATPVVQRNPMVRPVVPQQAPSSVIQPRQAPVQAAPEALPPWMTDEAPIPANDIDVPPLSHEERMESLGIPVAKPAPKNDADDRQMLLAFDDNGSNSNSAIIERLDRIEKLLAIIAKQGGRFR